ncbi:NAD(P)-dependent dehydrogenase (short-subunit alcohol dehydrogenase family) [Lipingzhangella halophila]|uniref:NAD(P)-dependent dehydrogenase (Short-subunit alcohol dehydrogenase family) n=1 Tax=Lipingzhangella halophila TaxID=1783352 RepID=A0A7W7RNJ0_9ACTN|nr:SDR family oxidoreductase [Lipingzhangella halophila]MBB4935260.1 NAD(P)-dependent dehydrogenase (short-subunit alcohol dehydrogenase family) [Lipingzhangella halophila]
MADPLPERVLVTGGASGIGAAIADRCAATGYEVLVLDRQPSEHPHTVVDLADPDATAAALESALASGPITRLVNNVGAVFPAAVEDATLAEHQSAWELNVRSAVQCTAALTPSMREAGFGRIVSLSSRAALGKEMRSAYAATKSALIGLTRVWALELGEHGITANAVGPGPIATPLFEEANPPGAPRTQAIVDSVPVGRMGTPQDVAHAVDFLLDARSGFVTGQTLYVCGGMTVGSASV